MSQVAGAGVIAGFRVSPHARTINAQCFTVHCAVSSRCKFTLRAKQGTNTEWHLVLDRSELDHCNHGMPDADAGLLGYEPATNKSAAVAVKRPASRSDDEASPAKHGKRVYTCTSCGLKGHRKTNKICAFYVKAAPAGSGQAQDSDDDGNDST